jgi:hypothetical protein
VYLLSNEKYQSGDESRTLSEAIPRQQIKQYMQERHKWDKETFDKVNLDAYATARRSNRRLERFSSRFAHGWLPTRKRMRTIGTAANDECIWCHDTETQDHLFQCPHQSAWRDEFVERLDKHLTDSATDPTVKEEVLECITSWLNQSNCPCKCDQLRIGRHLLIRGYVANEWTTLQERYYKDQHEPAKLSLNGQTWTRNLIHFLWDEAFQLWDKRNKEIYETEDDNNSTLLFDLKQQVRALYNLEEKVLARDRNNFALPLNERLTQHPIQLHNYIQIQGPIIRQSVKEAEKLAAAHTRQLPTYFPPR